MASFVTDQGARDLSVATPGTQIVWGTDVIKARLVALASTPARTDTNLSTNYTGIGTDQTLGTKTFTEDTTNHRTVYSAANPTWTAVAGGSTIAWVAIYKFVTNDAGSTPICIIDVTDTATNGGDITIQFDTNGIFYLQQ